MQTQPECMKNKKAECNSALGLKDQQIYLPHNQLSLSTALIHDWTTGPLQEMLP